MMTATMRRTVMLCTLIVAALGAGVTAVASPVRRGATYDGGGRQPHFLLTGGGAPDGRFVVRLVAARSGRQVESYVWGLPVACGSGSYIDGSPDPASARIRRDSTFRAILPANAGTVTMAGRFLAHGRARGTLRYRGLRGCHAAGFWTAQLKPPPPPVQHFLGTTAEGTQVTFERTIERNPHVTRFDFGLLSSTCGGTVRVRTGLELGPPFDVQFALPVHQDRFSGDYFDEAFDITITGSFGANNSATGTVGYGDRGGCVTSAVNWTASATSAPAG